MKINDQVSITEDELRFTASRSSGPGGQNVNKVNTRVTLWFDLGRSQSLTDFQKSRIRDSLASRINSDDVLQVSSQEHRTQAANREEARQRFAELLDRALEIEKPRLKKTMPRRIREKRLTEKARRGQVKRTRSKPVGDDDF